MDRVGRELSQKGGYLSLSSLQSRVFPIAFEKNAIVA
jgi:hypothetical protein